MTKTALKKAARAAKAARQEKQTAKKPNGVHVATSIEASKPLIDLEDSLPASAIEEIPIVSNYVDDAAGSISPPLQEPAAVIPLEPEVSPLAEPVEPAALLDEEPIRQNPLPIPQEAPVKQVVAPPVKQQVLPINQNPPPTDPEKVKKRQNILTRTLWTFIMIGVFIGTLLVQLTIRLVT